MNAKQKDPLAVELGRRGGLAGKGKRTERQAAASRVNGAKGGRPRKQRKEER